MGKEDRRKWARWFEEEFKCCAQPGSAPALVSAVGSVEREGKEIIVK